MTPYILDPKTAIPAPDQSLAIARQMIGELHNMLRIRFSRADGVETRVQWVEKPVDTATFFRDYVGEECYPIQQRLVNAVFGKKPSRWSTRYRRFVEAWGMGSGKDTTSAKIFVYAAYWLLCLENPQAYFAKPSNDRIDLINIAINGVLAKTVFFRTLQELFKKTINPKTGKNWFGEHGVDVREGKDIQTSEIHLPHNIILHSKDSEHETAVGMNVLMAVLDEIGGFAYKDAELIVENIENTMRSRFPRHYKLLFLSWPRHKNDYMMMTYKRELRKSEQLRDRGKKSKAFVTKAATWEVNLGVRKSDFADKFAEDPESARRVYMCEVGEGGEGNYIMFPEIVRLNVNWLRENPVQGNKHRTFDINAMDFKDWFRGDRNIDYFFHVDLGTGRTSIDPKDSHKNADAAGLTIAHNVRGMPVRYNEQLLDKMESIGFPRPTDGRKFGNGVYIDLVIQIVARPGREVKFADIINLIMRLRKERKFRFRKGSYDGFQSLGERQRLKDLGIEAELLSVDRTTEPYDNLKTLLYSGLLDYYHHIIFCRELEELVTMPEGKRMKIVHPARSNRRFEEEKNILGSKDTSDSCAAAVYLATQNFDSEFAAWAGSTKETELTTIAEFIDPALREQLVQTRLSHLARINAERQKLMEQAPLVQRGEVPLAGMDYEDLAVELGSMK